MKLYRDEGIVVRTYKLGETDRILVLLTAGHGKVRAVAKGARRPKSRLGGRVEPLTNLSLLLYRGRELDIVSQAETIDAFRPIREDLARLTDGLAMAEAIEQVATEGEMHPGLYRMLRGGLRALERRPAPLLVAGFYWKLLAADGSHPILDCCALCGTTDDDRLAAFDLQAGGLLCRSCRSGVPVSPAALALIRQILGGDLNGALGTPAGPLATEVTALATRSLEAHLERRLRALRVLDRA